MTWEGEFRCTCYNQRFIFIFSKICLKERSDIDYQTVYVYINSFLNFNTQHYSVWGNSRL